MIVNLKSGEALQGVLWATRGRWYTLQKASMLATGQAPAPIDGEAVIDRANIAFVQVLP